MAHELEVAGGKASFAFNAEAGMPWHRLGTAVQGLQTAEVMLEKANADYEVWTEPVFVRDERTGEFVEIPNRFATVRVNPHTDSLQSFEVFTTRYTVMQNREVLDRALKIVGASGGDAVIDTVGVLKDGAQFFASIDLGTLVIDPMGVGDKIARNLLCKGSHDGTFPLTYANTDIRAVCANTVRMAEKSARAVFKARHTPNAEARIEEANQVLGMSIEWAQSFKAQAEELLRIDVPLSSGRFDRVMEDLFPSRDADTDRKKANREELVTSIKVIYGNNRNGERVGFNGWGLFNAVVEHQDWHRAGSVQKLVEDAMNESGLTTQRKLRAQQAILALAN